MRNAAASVFPPSCNTGGISPDQPKKDFCRVDWVRFTFDESNLEIVREHLRYECAKADHVIEVDARGLWGYKQAVDLVCEAGTIGRLMWGGEAMRGTAAFDASGAGCDLLDLETLACLVEVIGARLTRVDLAADFHQGEVTLADAVDEYHAGGFTGSRGVTPRSRLVDDMGHGTGCTLYVGSREGSKFARIYEKGRQLGDASSPWVRVEVEFKRRDYELSADMLRRPAEFLAGSYPIVAEWIGAAAEKLAAIAKVVTAEVEHALHHARIQVGGVVAFLARRLGWPAARVVRELTRPIPSRKLERHAPNARHAEHWFNPDAALPVTLEERLLEVPA